MAQHDGYKKQHVAGRDSDGKFRILEHAKRDFAGCLVFRVSYLEKVDNQAFFKKKTKNSNTLRFSVTFFEPILKPHWRLKRPEFEIQAQ